ncbi:phosphate signaling complex protein PhoU [Acinetobacter baumannii]
MEQKHIHHQYDVDLQKISSLFLEMGDLVETQVEFAIRAIQNSDSALTQLVIQQEEKVNEYEIEIDALCSSVIARRQPIASDLRFIIAISKMTTNLERIGDEAEKIAQKTRRLISERQLKLIDNINILEEAKISLHLLSGVLTAFSRQDIKQAQEVINQDKALDDAFVQILNTLMLGVYSGGKDVSILMDCLFMAKGIERIGDHTKNIAEQIIYMVEGVDIRHK